MRALYLHIPFCTSRCSYCDFLSMVLPDEETAACYIRALLSEVALSAPLSPETLYIGGGTPSVLGPGLWVELLEGLGERVDFSLLREFTVEANPETVDAEKADIWKAYGVSRVSLGVQSFDDFVLVRWGRGARKEDIIRAAGILGGFSLSIDLILGLQAVHGDGGADVFRDDLDRLAELAPENCSVYMLTLYSRKLDFEFIPFADETYEKLYLSMVDFLESAGYEQYEISNFAKPGRESIHNIHYWMGHDYTGLGLGAVSTHGDRRLKNTEDLDLYLSALERGGEVPGEVEILDPEIKLRERIMLGLRTRAGVPVSLLEELHGPEDGWRETAGMLAGQGLARLEEGRLALTPRGLLRSTSICAELWGHVA